MRIKSLLLTIALCGAFVSAIGANQADADTTELGVHPFKETRNMAWKTTGFSMVLHGGLNFFDGDYPTSAGRFSTMGYGGGLNFEYNFSPVWGLGLGYNFAWTSVKTARATDTFLDVNLQPMTVSKGYTMHQGMMHSGQVYLTFDLINAWFPRAWKDIFALSVFAGFGASWYHNNISFHDTGIMKDDGKTQDPMAKYIQDGDADHAHKKVDDNGQPTSANAYAMVGYVPLGASAEFNVSRQIALGARFQYNLYINDYVDNRYQDKANKNNDGRYDVELVLRWKIAAKKKNHVMNVSSADVMEEKYYQSHPHRRKRPHVVDTLVVYHQDTLVIIHRDTVVMMGAPTEAVVEPAPAVEKVEGRCDLELYPGWESKADAVVVEGQSLSQLARKYYNNTFCWVYLWIANRSIAQDPNLIMPKCVLKVPKLDDCQKSITKQEAKDMCARKRAQE